VSYRGKTWLSDTARPVRRTSLLLEPDIAAILQNRPPASDSDSVTQNAVPDWLRPFIWVFVSLSDIGLVVSLRVHVEAIMGRAARSFFWVLHMDILVVWFPSVLVAQRLAGNAITRIRRRSS
jgi:hypothetical protein